MTDPIKFLNERIFSPTREGKITAPRDMLMTVKTHSGTLQITLYKGDTLATQFDGSLLLNDRWRFQIVKYNPPDK